MHIFKDFERQPITYFSIDFFYKIGFKGKYRYSVSNEIVITKRKSNVQHIYPRFWMGGGRGEGCACGYVCLSIRSRNSKTIAPIDLIFLHKKEYTCGSVLV